VERSKDEARANLLGEVRKLVQPRLPARMTLALASIHATGQQLHDGIYTQIVRVTTSDWVVRLEVKLHQRSNGGCMANMRQQVLGLPLGIRNPVKIVLEESRMLANRELRVRRSFCAVWILPMLAHVVCIVVAKNERVRVRKLTKERHEGSALLRGSWIARDVL